MLVLLIIYEYLELTKLVEAKWSLFLDGSSTLPGSTIEQSILTFVRFKHIVSTSKEVDFLHLRKERIDLDDQIKNKRITL